MNIVSVTDFRNNIGTYIDRVIYNNEEFLLKKGKAIVAKVMKDEAKDAPKEKAPTLLDLAGAWKGEPAKIFKKYLKTVSKKDEEDIKKLLKL